MMIDNSITLDSQFTGQDFANNMNSLDLFDMRVVDNELSFEDFVTFSYFFGRGNAPDFPFFYASYKFFEADADTDH
jgi:hypothetical protein